MKIFAFIVIAFVVLLLATLLKEGGIAVFSIAALILFIVYKGMFPKKVR